MLRRLSLRDFVIVDALEVEFSGGFSVLTGETGAGKSILIDALQLALGSRGDAVVVREGAPRAEISAEFDTPASLASWLQDAGIDGSDGMLLRRSIDAQGRSRAWINGSAATVTQLRELADHLLDIHGQHAWQGLTRAASVRELLDAQASVDTAPLLVLWQAWRAAAAALDAARAQQDSVAQEHERLSWQITELERLAPGADEWDELNTEHQRLAHAQALIDAARDALTALDGGDSDASSLSSQAIHRVQTVAHIDPQLAAVLEVLQSAQAQLQDAARSLQGYLHHTDLDPERLAQLDERLSQWLALARRYRRTPPELPAVLTQWRAELLTLARATDVAALERDALAAEQAWRGQAERISGLRHAAAAPLAQRVTQAMQTLGMAGGCFEVELHTLDTPQAHGLETVELLVAGHAGASARPLAKVASGGELSRLALAIAVTTCGEPGTGAATLIFDEVDAGVGGKVADTVGRLLKRLGRERQVLAVTHLAQVAACADQHFVVSKSAIGAATLSAVHLVQGEARVAEVSRMLGGDQLGQTSAAHAQAMLSAADDQGSSR